MTQFLQRHFVKDGVPALGQALPPATRFTLSRNDECYAQDDRKCTEEYGERIKVDRLVTQNDGQPAIVPDHSLPPDGINCEAWHGWPPKFTRSVCVPVRRL